MNAEQYFGLTNTVALAAWIALIVAPGKRAIAQVACGVLVPAGLAVSYVGVIGWRLAAGGPPPEDLMTIAGLRQAFTDDWVFAAAWTHYLAFDMVAGAWIARDAVRLTIPWYLRTVSLMLTFLSGPTGFLMHIIVRMILRRPSAVDA